MRMPEHTGDSHQETGDEHHHPLLHKLMLGTALAVGAVILAPYVLPALGIGSSGIALEAIGALHTLGMGTGLAGLINTGLHAIPLIGPTLAQGGAVTAITSSVIGIGGVLLGRFLEKKQDGRTGVNWGKVIKYGALMTSALIAMPSILAGISIGITFLCDILPASLAVDPVPFLAKTIGSNGISTLSGSNLGSLSALVPHLLTCGAVLFPTLFSAGLAAKSGALPVLPSASTRLQLAREANTAVQPVQSNSAGPIQLALLCDRSTTAGVPWQGKLRIINTRSGQPVTNDALATIYTRKLHLYIVDQSLKDYHHIHPEPAGEPGVFAFSFTPQTSNRYDAWTDFTRLEDGRNYRMKVEIPAAAKRNIPAVIRANDQAEAQGLVFGWRSDPLRKGEASLVEVTVTDTRGNPVTDLEPVMGAYAHLAGFSADGNHFIHTHPLSAQHSGPTLRFHVEPDYSGPTQFYLQARHCGQDIHVPFGQQILPPEKMTDRLSHGRQEMHAMEHGMG